MLDLAVIDSDVLVFDVNVVKQLRNLGILGNFMGSLAAAPQQNSFLGLPLKLSPYEILWLVDNRQANLVKHKGITRINNHKEPYFYTQYNNEPSELEAVDIEVIRRKANPSSYSIFCQLKHQGYYLLPGLKFGGEFIAYPGDPLRYHSHVIVHPVSEVNFYSLIVSGRLATGVKKLYVISEPDETDPTFNITFSIEWAGFG
ncbi:tRNA-intron endonuclease catalytic domain-like protein [Yamadazyma tenuis ATCC 10573]|uniref:tRNA-intron lyase n=1 Tax=Candida tenuis (strain ATCC 10573 / BCRC 21748 / CBS 615 / JCM 9827 / NBRC 10315 / NRRL Y-1498 / VKM Y-70) TaxID=590646 RepID=G3B2I5_CANTC|nr:tRNA-intron endonuclease catalytic domain-like protein [Yamadazyma tenuis ATCC 10573]EGV64684.1 tRNA-intron endonuclease catalytic domain-like protein [Yamadazyma tenuis ATCC 10573]